MDILTLAGLLLAGCAILIGAVLKGAGLSVLLSPAAFMIVVVGTLGAICMQTPLRVMRRALHILPWVMRPPDLHADAVIRKMLDWSHMARKQGLLALEPVLQREPDEFTRKALQMVVDGREPELIRGTMEVELETRERADYMGARVFEGMGVYSPTLGIIGAVLGLMAVMQNLGDPSRLGHGIAAAFTATIYGIALANLLFLPVSSKLKTTIQAQSRFREMIIEGMLAIAQGENPRTIESRLQGFI